MDFNLCTLKKNSLGMLFGPVFVGINPLLSSASLAGAGSKVKEKALIFEHTQGMWSVFVQKIRVPLFPSFS